MIIFSARPRAPNVVMEGGLHLGEARGTYALMVGSPTPRVVARVVRVFKDICASALRPLPNKQRESARRMWWGVISHAMKSSVDPVPTCLKPRGQLVPRCAQVDPLRSNG